MEGQEAVHLSSSPIITSCRLLSHHSIIPAPALSSRAAAPIPLHSIMTTSPTFSPMTASQFAATSTVLSSPSNRSLPHQLGIDEAGRGPVLGPMVYAYAACPLSSSDDLKSLGFADSKTLNATQRSSLLTALLSSPILSAHAISLSPQHLSALMQATPRTSLNVISHDTAIALIHQALASGLRVSSVFVDTVGDPMAYQSKLEAVFPTLQFTVTSKADSLFPIVSAASIVAKTTRDRELEEWAFTEDVNPSTNSGGQDAVDLTTAEDPLLVDDGDDDDVIPVRGGTKRKTPSTASSPSPVDRADSLGRVGRLMGSGYPGDPLTKAWLVDHLDPVFGFPSVVRFSWQTSRTLLKDKGYGVVWHDEVDEDRAEDDVVKHTQRMEAFLVKKTEGGKGTGRAATDISVQKAAIPLKERAQWYQHHKLHLLTSLT